MRKVIISDTSTLIIFDKIGRLDLLQKVYKELITTHFVTQLSVRRGFNYPNVLINDLTTKHKTNFKSRPNTSRLSRRDAKLLAVGYFDVSSIGSFAFDSISFASASFFGNKILPLNSSNFLLILTTGIFALFNSSTFIILLFSCY